MSKVAYRAGFVAVVGRPNVGKSTLINRIVGRKVSIVTPKAQTTRYRILGILTGDDAQVLFVDTPGLHRDVPKAMNRMMNRTVLNALADADVVLLVAEAGRWTDEDESVLRRVAASGKPSVAVLNKVDRVRPKKALLGSIAELAARHEFAEIVPLSARTGDNLEALLRVLPPLLPESPPLYPGDAVSDRSEAFRAAEVIREKLTLELRHELPYGLTVQLERFAQEERGVAIEAVVWVERESQKGIVVGKGGAVLKKIGRQARLELKREYGRPVHLELWVKVRENWADSDKDLARFGYELP